MRMHVLNDNDDNEHMCTYISAVEEEDVLGVLYVVVRRRDVLTQVFVATT